MFEQKVDAKSSSNSYNNKAVVGHYVDLTRHVGLWKSEEYIFERFVPKTSRILDVGCGAGRTTFGLFEKGYRLVDGVDVSKKLISMANKIAKEEKAPIKFKVDNAMALNAKNESFDVVFFSYNGLMTIPGFKNRLIAVSEIARVLKPGGLFIFTTHDREKDERYRQFWKEEKLRFENKTADKRLVEFGDRITEEDGEEMFVHIPDTKEVYSLLDACGFDCIYTKMRWDICATPKIEKELFGECRFFVAKKRA